MATTWGGLFNVVALAVLVQVAAAATYTVGGSEGGWDLSTDLLTWASAQTFVPGDSLSFTYAPSHDVVEVTKAEYDACTASRPIQSYTGGSTVIKLSAPGKRHFICGIAGHCTAGMKLEVDVVSAAAAAATPPPVPTPTNPEAPAASNGPRSPASSPLGSGPSTASSSSEPPAVDLVLAPVSPPPSQSAADGEVGHTKLAIGLTMGMLIAAVL